MTKRSILIVPYIILILSLLGFLLYFLTLRPGGASGNVAVVWALTSFASGGMVMMAIYGLTLYIYRHKEKAALYFSLLCVLLSVRFVFMSGSVTIRGLFPAIPAVIALFVNYITLPLMILCFHRFVYEIFIKPKRKRTAFAFDMITITVYVTGGIITLLRGGDNKIIRGCIFLMAFTMLVHIAVEVFRSPELKKNRLNWLYFISLLLYIALIARDAFIPNIFPNTAIFSNMLLVIFHVILLSQRYSRTIDDNELLDKLNRTKTELFTTISHNMKTPLTIIATDIQLAQKFIEEKDISRANGLLQEAWHETMSLGDQVTDAITLAGNSEFLREMSLIDIAEVIKGTLKIYEPILKKQGNTLLQNMEKNVPQIMSNADMLTSVLKNILDNANRHTKNGIINVKLSQIDESECCLEITDNGSGIEKDLLPKVFERGISGAASSGLGLAIVKNIMDLHNGKVTIESELGKGTTVKLFFMNHERHERHEIVIR